MSAPSKNAGGETLGADEPSSSPLLWSVEACCAVESDVGGALEDASSSLDFGSDEALDELGSLESVTVPGDVELGSGGGGNVDEPGATLVFGGGVVGLTLVDVSVDVAVALVWSGAEFAPLAQLTNPNQRKLVQERAPMRSWPIVFMIHGNAWLSPSDRLAGRG
jgi:hypothetical protein